MVCSPSDNSINPPAPPPPPFIPGFGIAFAPPQIPFPDLNLGSSPEDLLELVNTLLARFPGATFKPNLDEYTKTVLQAVNNLLNKIAPYLALYSFFQALLNMILCIVDIICALMNPFKLYRAIRKMFKTCLPDFLNLFPWLALLVMIVSIMLLILAIIEYIVQLILAYINDILQNILLLQQAFQYSDVDGALSIITKISQLLCLIQDIFSFFVALAAIMAIIEALASLGGRFSCVKGQSDCCTDDVCPPFITENPSGISGTSGVLVYHNQRNQDTTLFPAPITLPPVRQQSWQFYDTDSFRQYNIKDIITPISGFTYWPANQVFSDMTVPQPTSFEVQLNEDTAFSIPGITPVSSETYNNFFLYSVIRKSDGASLLNDDTRISGVNVYLASPALPDDIVTVTYIDNMGNRKVPYALDMRILVNPAEFGIDPAKNITVAVNAVTDGYVATILESFTAINSATFNGSPLTTYLVTGQDVKFPLNSGLFDLATVNVNITPTITTRSFRIKECIVKSQPYIGYFNYANALVPPNTGTFAITGGRVFEDDGFTPVIVNGTQATIENFIYKPATLNIPPFEDGYFFTAEYTWRPNYESLFAFQLISSACMPELQAESAVANADIDIRPAIDKIGSLPNVNETLNCLTNQLLTYRKNVSIESTQEFQSQVILCLEKLKSDAKTTLSNAVIAGTSTFNTEVTLDPDLQFINLPIQVKVTPKDKTSNDIAASLPADTAANLADKISAIVTVGEITKFVYDGYGSFFADINSKIPGEGTITVLVDGQVVSRVIGRDNPDIVSSIEPVVLSYEFVGKGQFAGGFGDTEQKRRDDSDIARN